MAAVGGRLDLQGLGRRFGTFAAVESCDLKVEGGEFVTLLGPSGSGKTTILRMVAGFIRPSAGRIEIDGQDVRNVPAHRRNLGVVFQSYTLFPHMTAAENIAFPLQMRGVSREQQRRLVVEALDRVRLKEVSDRHPQELSGGQQQRVAVARALVFGPRILLMDEPFGALDKRLREELQAEVRRLHQTLGVTVVFVTHDQAEALAMSDRIAIMNGGRLEQVGTGSELYESPKSLFVADFMGESNVFRGRLLARGAARWVAGDGWEYPVGPSAQVDGVTPGDAVAMICRPERMRIARVDGTLSQPTCLVGRLTKTTYLGGISRHEISLREGRSVTVVTLGPDRSGAAPGDEVRVEWCADDTIVVPDTGPGGDTP